MKKYCKLVCLSVALSMLFLVLAGCGAKQEPKGDAPAKSEQSQAAPQEKSASEEKKEPLKEAALTFYFPGEAKKDTRMVLDEAEKRLKDSLNVKLNFNFIPWGDYTNKINVLIASGDEYEVHFDADWFMFPILSQKGALLDITEMLPKYAPKIYEKEADVFKKVRVNGKIMSVPWYYPKNDRVTAVVREDLKAKHGIPDIMTFEDYEFYLKTLKEKEPGIIPYASGVNRNIQEFYVYGDYAVLSFPLDLVYKWDDKNMKVIPWEQTPEYKQIIEIKRRWYENGYMPKDMFSVQDFTADLTDGKVTSILHVWNEIENHNKKVANTHPGWKFAGYALYPEKVGPKASPMNNAVVFNANGKNPERAMMFLEWVREKQENYDLIIFGIEGKHYVLENGLLKQPHGVTDADNPYQGWHGQWGLYDIDLHRFSVNDPPNYKQMNIDSANLNADYVPHLGFFPNLDGIKNEVAQRQAAYDEMGKLLEYGALPKEKADEYIEKQKKAGTDKIVSEIQRQLDEWKAKNK